MNRFRRHEVAGSPLFARSGRRSLACCAAVGALLAGLAFTASAEAAGDSAQAWGRNDSGQLGNGTKNPSSTPVPVSGLSDAVAITAGTSHTLALRSDRTVVAWGDNSYGQLGDGTTNPSSTPIPVTGLSGVVAIATSPDSYHTLALRQDGTVVAWGKNEFGELGDGATNATGCRCIASPVAVTGLSNVVAISAGDAAGMALLRDGTVRSWGFNGDGDVGNGTTSTTGCRCVDSPVKVSGLSHVVAISAYSYDGLALLANGTAMSWGNNAEGELGNGTVPTNGCLCVTKPTRVSGVSHVVAITAGYAYAIALLQSGSARGWGFNGNGELGTGTSSVGGCECFYSPVAVSGLSHAATIASGENHTLALLTNGTLMGWGENDYGQLGNGTAQTTGCQCLSAPTAVSALGGATAVAGGGEHSLALTGPSQTLHVARAGAGTGVVGGAGILCPQECSQRYPRGAFAILRAQPGAAIRFAGYSGACTSTRNCQIRMSGDRALVATFGPPKGTKITTATVNKKERSARFSFTAPGAITSFQCELIKPKRKNHRRPKPSYSTCSTPKRYKHLKSGKYTFTVRARDIVGADAKAAKGSFQV